MHASPGSARSALSLTLVAAVAAILLAACATALPGAGTTGGMAQAPADGATGPGIAAVGDTEAMRLSEGDVAGLPAAVLAPDVMPRPADDGSASQATDGALIVRTGSLELEAGDVPDALRRARQRIAALGGYVAGSDEVDGAEGRRWASITYRVPVEGWDDALEALRGLADRVVRETTQAQEVTAAVVDLDARISNLRASEEALTSIMDRAGSIDDVLSVQVRLQETREQIERLVAQRDSLADQAAMATLWVSWSTPVPAVVATQQGWDLGAEIDAAAAQTVAALQGLVRVLVWLAVVAAPLAALPLIVVGLLVLVVRRRGARPGTGGPPGGMDLEGVGVE